MQRENSIISARDRMYVAKTLCDKYGLVDAVYVRCLRM